MIIVCPNCKIKSEILAGICVNCKTLVIKDEPKNQFTEKELTLFKFTLPLIILLVTYYYIFVYPIVKEQEKNRIYPSNNYQPVQNAWDGSMSPAVEWLKNNLKDYSSYESIEWSNVKQTTDKDGNNIYMVKNKYRAKNSFGAYDIQESIFFIDKNGSIINVINSH